MSVWRISNILKSEQDLKQTGKLLGLIANDQGFRIYELLPQQINPGLINSYVFILKHMLCYNLPYLSWGFPAPFKKLGIICISRKDVK